MRKLNPGCAWHLNATFCPFKPVRQPWQAATPVSFGSTPAAAFIQQTKFRLTFYNIEEGFDGWETWVLATHGTLMLHFWSLDQCVSHDTLQHLFPLDRPQPLLSFNKLFLTRFLHYWGGLWWMRNLSPCCAWHLDATFLIFGPVRQPLHAATPVSFDWPQTLLSFNKLSFD